MSLTPRVPHYHTSWHIIDPNSTVCSSPCAWPHFMPPCDSCYLSVLPSHSPPTPYKPFQYHNLLIKMTWSLSLNHSTLSSTHDALEMHKGVFVLRRCMLGRKRNSFQLWCTCLCVCSTYMVDVCTVGAYVCTALSAWKQNSDRSWVRD